MGTDGAGGTHGTHRTDGAGGTEPMADAIEMTG